MSERRTAPDSGGDGGDGRTGDVRDDGTDGVVEQLSADAAFELLGNEKRLSILRALFDADAPVGFSALNDAVDVRDSGQFNYHLDKLLGTFARKTDDGYELTAEGLHVVGSILAGPYTKTVEAARVPVDADCSHCGRSLAGFFGEELVRVACTGCDRNVIKLAVPPGAFEEYPREEWPLVAERWTRREFETVQSGFCPVCHGHVSGEIVEGIDDLHDVFDLGARFVCGRCGQDRAANVEASVLSHPAVVSFHHQRGVDVTETPVWELDWAVRPVAEVVADDPLRVEVPIELDGDRLVLTLDENVAVVDERVE